MLEVDFVQAGEYFVYLILKVCKMDRKTVFYWETISLYLRFSL